MSRQGDDVRPAKPFVAKFGVTGSLRQRIGMSGRVHVDRWLPFIILNRGDEGRASLARRIAIESPSYLVWPTDDDQSALEAMREVISAMASKGDRLLVISLDDRPVEFEEEGGGLGQRQA